MYSSSSRQSGEEEENIHSVIEEEEEEGGGGEGGSSEEIVHFQGILRAFRYYGVHCNKWLQVMEMAYTKLPSHHQLLLNSSLMSPSQSQSQSQSVSESSSSVSSPTSHSPSPSPSHSHSMTFQDKLQRIRYCVQQNEQFLSYITSANQLFENLDMKSYYTLDEEEPLHQSNQDDDHSHSSTLRQQLESDTEKVKSTLRQFVREWSDEGAIERGMCYQPILAELASLFPPHSRKGVQVVCPGSGLGRLPFEIAKMGFSCQGNEFSYFMLLSSNFILNSSTKKNEFTLYPFVHQTSNVLQDSDMFRPITIPDSVPMLELPKDADFSMCAGDFVEVYQNQIGVWDCVVTCFFIDTARNIIQYIETIAKMLKPGGTWINFGPLQYHFAEVQNYCVELSMEQIEKVAQSYGLIIVKKEYNKSSTYVNNIRSMVHTLYDCSFLTAIKR